METQECLLCLRIPVERIKISVKALLPHVDDAMIDHVSERAAKLIASAYEKDRIALCGKKPSGLMGAAIYLSGIMEKGVKISQGLVAREMNITVSTIGKRAHQIDDILGLGITEKSRRLKLYVCPFCKESFSAIFNLKLHLTYDENIKNTDVLKVRMFNDDGILIDEKKLRKRKRDPGTCERPLAVEVEEVIERHIVTGGQGSGQSYFGQGDRLAIRGRYVVTG